MVPPPVEEDVVTAAEEEVRAAEVAASEEPGAADVAPDVPGVKDTPPLLAPAAADDAMAVEDPVPVEDAPAVLVAVAVLVAAGRLVAPPPDDDDEACPPGSTQALETHTRGAWQSSSVTHDGVSSPPVVGRGQPVTATSAVNQATANAHLRARACMPGRVAAAPPGRKLVVTG